MKPPVGHVARVVVALTMVVGGALASSVAASGSARIAVASVDRATRARIENAFRHLVKESSVTSERSFIQGYDVAMAGALGDAYGSGFGEGGGVTTLSEAFGALHRASPTVVTVPVTFTEPGAKPWMQAQRHYIGTAVRTGGRWKVSWATACTILEASQIVCPPAPPGVQSTVPPPSYDPPESTAPFFAPGLVDPSGLAVEPDGSLLIADSGRDQVLRRTPAGSLQVFAGTGASGFSGDGGPAIDAELDLGGTISLAVAPDGTVYISDAGNNRVRAVHADGAITTVAGDGTAGHTGDDGRATDAELDGPTGLAVGPDGSLYIADGSYVRKVAPDGTITTIAGGGPPVGVDVDANGTSVAFSPESLAFDGAGDLDVFSFSPKLIFQLPAGPDGPSGTGITEVATDYATALASAPDGSVMVAEHGAGLQRITGGHIESVDDFLDTPVAGYPAPGTVGAFSPEGVAVAPDGTVYLDTDADNGYSPQSALVEVNPRGHAAILPVTGLVPGTFPPVDAAGFPAATYPVPVPARPGAGIAACPSRTGLDVFDGAARTLAASEAAGFNTAFPDALKESDRSWWTAVYRQWADPAGLGHHAVMRVEAATRDLYAPVVAHACGPGILARSLVVVVGRSAYSTEVSHIYFVDRDGRPLVYYQNA
jgi:hypothetical protein